MTRCVAFRFDAPLFFANARTFREQVLALTRSDPSPLWIIVAAEPITDVDTTAADMLEDLDESLRDVGIRLVFAEMKDPVRRKLDRYELTRKIDLADFFPTLTQAFKAFREETGADWHPPGATSPTLPPQGVRRGLSQRPPTARARPSGTRDSDSG
jgi:MFS superfamily sulfate permease-like transporter